MDPRDETQWKIAGNWHSFIVAWSHHHSKKTIHE